MKKLSLILIIFATIGCSKSGRNRGNFEQKSPWNGTIAPALDKIQNHKNVTACEQNIREQQFEVAQALDARADEIKRFSEKYYSKADDSTLVQAGPVTFRQSKSKKPTAPKWDRDTYGWKNIIETFNQIKNTPIDDNWLFLDKDVRGILPDDLDRVIGGLPYHISFSDREALLKTLKKFDACQLDSRCERPALEADEMSFINNRYYKNYWKNLDDADFETKRKIIRAIYRDLDLDWNDFFQFRKNWGVKNINSTTFELPLNGSVFAEGITVVQQIIEQVWSATGLSLRIKWIDSSEAFKFIIDLTSLNGRAAVNSKAKTIELYNFGRTGTLAHELGHVLGFRDEYYITWQQETCQYTQESQSANLMSNSRYGVVQPRHFEVLKAAYIDGRDPNY